jgi:Na+/H+ antiporter NhaD/arsenite permease-like protein
MHGTHEVNMILGLDPGWYAGTLFVLTYLLIVTERLNRAIVSLGAAVLMILGGVLTQEAAFQGVDFNTLGLLTGMMVIVGITKNSGIFQYLAIWSAKLVKADPWGILLMLMIVTAVLSALLDNVTTVLLIAPVTLLITDELKIKPYPFLFAEIFASNIGGTATLIGDPPNIMIGSAVGLSFNDFLFNLTPVVLLILPLTVLPIYLIWGRKLAAAAEDRERVMKYRERDAIKNTRLLKQSLFVLALVLIGFPPRWPCSAPPCC